MIRPQQTQELSPALSSQIVPKNILAKSKGYNQKQSEPHTQRLRFLKSFSYQKIELILKGVLMDDLYQNSSFSQLDEPDPKEKTMDLFTKDLDYMEKIKELQGYLDMVKKIARPGCSQEVLNVASSSMSSLVNFLSSMSSRSKTLASL